MATPLPTVAVVAAALAVILFSANAAGCILLLYFIGFSLGINSFLIINDVEQTLVL